MGVTRKYSQLQGILIRLFILLTLFFPAFYSPLGYEEGGEYFVLISVPYLVLGLFLIVMIWNNKGAYKKREDLRFFWMLLGVFVLYNLLSFFYNIKYLHWYGEQLNNTIAIAFFACLVRYRFFEGEEGKGLIRFLMASIVISNLCSILYFFMGYTSFAICNNRIIFYQLTEDYYEFRHYWLYSHKSDYALQLVLFLALFLRMKKLVNRRWLWWCSVLVLLFALGLTHSWTSVASAVCVAVGAVLDEINWKKIVWKKWHIGGAIGIGALICGFLWIFLRERNISNFGSRPALWKGALEAIKTRPNGLGMWFGEYPIEAVGEGWASNNAHNVFLNALLRFSIPVGICFLAIFIMIMVYCILKSKKKWLTLGTWGAAMLLLNMDYSLLNYELAMFLMVMYLVALCDTAEGDGGYLKWDTPELSGKEASSDAG